jgi:hypothetical protein
MNDQRLLARSLLLLLAVSVLALAGCSRTKVPEPADPEKAREALRTVLDAWKNGVPPSTLGEGSPPIRVIDYEWDAGRRLQDYKLEDQGDLVGNSLHVAVVLHQLDDSNAPMEPITVTYMVTTSPALEVARYDSSN